MARVSLPNPIIYLDQAQPASPDSNNSLIAVQTAAKKLKDSLDTLNADLEKVVNKEIDRTEVKFNTSKDKLATLKTTWEGYSRQLQKKSDNQDIVNLIGKINKDIASLDKTLSPLNQNIIQSLKEYNRKKNNSTYSIQKIPKLEEYQKQLFGTESNPTNSDGIFGSGTQGKIKEVLDKSINNLTANFGEIEKNPGQGESPSVSPSPEDSSLEAQVKSLQEEVGNLKTQVEQQDKTIKELKNKLEGEAITGGSGTDRNPLALVLVTIVLATVVGFIGWRAWKSWQVSRKKNDFLNKSQFSDGDNKATDTRKSTKSSVIPPLIIESQKASPGNPYIETSFNQNLSQTSPSQREATNLTGTSHQTINPPGQALHQVLPNLESIQSEEDLVAFYNRNPRALEEKIIVVTTTEDSFEQQRAGHSAPIIFQKSPTGNYWITLVPQLQSPYYFLVPKANLVVSRPNYATFQEIFDCKGYQTKACNKFKLILPAVVTYEPEGYWKLYALGELEFH
jgi:predicted  nucleic acid-binding Zn-ribbon protein